jgi:hypothetical protein
MDGFHFAMIGSKLTPDDGTVALVAFIHRLKHNLKQPTKMNNTVSHY